MSATASAPPTEASTQNATRVGRGALFITAAKLWFMGTGAVVNFALGSLLGAAEYGNYGITIRWVSLLNMMVVQGLLQGMSRTVAADPHAAATLWRQARPVALGVGLLAGGGVVALAGPVAGALLDPSLVPGLRVAGLITAAYALYAPQVGVLNGLQRFSAQAALDASFSTVKLVGILGAAALGLGAAGSVGGFGVSALVMAAVTARVLRGVLRGVLHDAPRGDPTVALNVKTLMGFSGLVMVYQAALNLLMLVDLGLVKRLLGAELAGHYTAAVNLAQVPYLGCTAVTFVVFPLLGQEPTLEAARHTTRSALRYALLIGGPVSAAMMATAPGVLGAVFPAAFMDAAPALTFLCGAYLCAALLSVGCAMLNALGRPGWSAACVAVGVALSAAGCALMVGPLGMLGGALGALLGMGAALVASLAALWATGRLEVPWASVVRHGVVLVVAALVGPMVPWPAGGALLRVAGVLGAALAGVLALVALVLMGEVGRPEWDLLMRVLGRKKAPAAQAAVQQ